MNTHTLTYDGGLVKDFISGDALEEHLFITGIREEVS